MKTEEENLDNPQKPQLNIPAVSSSFSAEDMIKAFNAGGKHIYECEANGKDKKCYCRNDNDCNHRHYISAEEWLKNYR
jgi:hypothetical protein